MTQAARVETTADTLIVSKIITSAVSDYWKLVVPLTRTVLVACRDFAVSCAVVWNSAHRPPEFFSVCQTLKNLPPI